MVNGFPIFFFSNLVLNFPSVMMTVRSPDGQCCGRIIIILLCYSIIYIFIEIFFFHFYIYFILFQGLILEYIKYWFIFLLDKSRSVFNKCILLCNISQVSALPLDFIRKKYLVKTETLRSLQIFVWFYLTVGCNIFKLKIKFP